MPFSFFNISKSDFCELNSDKKWWLDSDMNQNEEDYDESCKRYTVDLSDTFIKHIYNLSKLDLSIKIKDTVSHYVKYNINNFYQIDEHTDHCPITIIVYLYKDTNLEESLFVEKKYVKHNYWKNEPDMYQCMVMWSEKNGNNEEGPCHSVDIKGYGNREILAIFLG